MTRIHRRHYEVCGRTNQSIRQDRNLYDVSAVPNKPHLKRLSALNLYYPGRGACSDTGDADGGRFSALVVCIAGPPALVSPSLVSPFDAAFT